MEHRCAPSPSSAGSARRPRACGFFGLGARSWNESIAPVGPAPPRGVTIAHARRRHALPLAIEGAPTRRSVGNRARFEASLSESGPEECNAATLHASLSGDGVARLLLSRQSTMKPTNRGLFLALWLIFTLALASCASRRVPASFPEGSPAAAETKAGAIPGPTALGASIDMNGVEAQAEGDPSGHDHHHHGAARETKEREAHEGHEHSAPDTNQPEPGREGHEHKGVDGRQAAEHQQDEPAREPAPATYSCPMHSEVTSKEPGRCPKCGMRLEKNP